MSDGEPDAPAATAGAAGGVRRALAGAAVRIAGLLYGLGARAHRALMRRTAAGRGRLACAVVSVGGLTVGGAGKTPVAARIALALRGRGWRVVLASRGYKGRDRASVSVVSDGTYVRSTVARSGDESLVLAAHAPGVPVLVGRDRRVVGHHAVAAFDAQIVVLDDGFQHHRLARDLDVVCIDGHAGLGNRRTLPAGPLREPVSALRHADWLCIVDPPSDGAPVPGMEGVSVERIRARRRPTGLRSIDGGSTRALASLEGARIGLLAGVARPRSVRRTLEALGAHVVVERIFPDHHAYAPTDLAGLADARIDWVTTEKDGFKILPDWLGGARLWVLRIEVEIEEEGRFLDRIEAALVARGRLAPTARTATDGDEDDALASAALSPGAAAAPAERAG
jgi:tetraacyldisaccharide 4'-kinase